MIYEINKKKPQIGKRNFIAPTSVLIGDIVTGENVSIWFNAVLRGDSNRIIIGDNSNIQDNATLHVEYVKGIEIGRNVTIGHNCIIHGCDIGDNSLIGMGSILMTGTKIPKNSLVAAGSLVNSKMNAPECSLIAGNPAKVIKQLDERYLQLLKDSNDEYIERLELYEKDFQGAE